MMDLVSEGIDIAASLGYMSVTFEILASISNGIKMFFNNLKPHYTTMTYNMHT